MAENENFNEAPLRDRRNFLKYAGLAAAGVAFGCGDSSKSTTSAGGVGDYKACINTGSFAKYDEDPAKVAVATDKDGLSRTDTVVFNVKWFQIANSASGAAAITPYFSNAMADANIFSISPPTSTSPVELQTLWNAIGGYNGILKIPATGAPAQYLVPNSLGNGYDEASGVYLMDLKQPRVKQAVLTYLMTLVHNFPKGLNLQGIDMVTTRENWPYHGSIVGGRFVKTTPVASSTVGFDGLTDTALDVLANLRSLIDTENKTYGGNKKLVIDEAMAPRWDATKTDPITAVGANADAYSHNLINSMATTGDFIGRCEAFAQGTKNTNRPAQMIGYESDPSPNTIIGSIKANYQTLANAVYKATNVKLNMTTYVTTKAAAAADRFSASNDMETNANLPKDVCTVVASLDGATHDGKVHEKSVQRA